MAVSEQVLLTRIGVVGDVHAESHYLEAVLAFLQDQHFPVVLCVGDIVDGRGNVNQCCQLLQQYHVRTVRGNRDRWFSNNHARQLPEATQSADVEPFAQEFIANLPITQDFKTISGDLLLCHGIGANDMGRVNAHDIGYALESNLELQELLQSGRYHFLINGHTHRRLVRRFGKLVLINAGTLKHDHNPCFLIADFESKAVQYYDVSPSRQFNISNELPL